MHRPGRLQADRAALPRRECQCLVRAHFAIRPLEEQRHGQFRKQFAAVGIHDLHDIGRVVVAQPNDVPPTVFAMEDRGEGWIRFVNEAHDLPNRVEYRRCGP